MKLNRDFNIRVPFVADVILILFFILTGTNWFLSLIMVEAFMWLVRLYWISGVLLLFIAKRLLHMIPIILSVVAIGFLLIQMAPGDIFTQMTLNPNLKSETIDRYRAAFGLDKEWYIQFFRYLWNALHLDFGYSINYKTAVFNLVSQRAGNTLILAVTTIIISWGLSIPAGIYSATHQYKPGDHLITIIAFIGLALPNFFLAFLLIFLVSSTGSWLPIGGMWSVDVNQMNFLQKVVDLFRHMAIPVFVLATSNMASLTRIMRANMLEIMSQQYITTARAKGLTERTVVYRHALRNAINPMITIFGYQFGYILGGSALVEAVTAWPGLGSLMLQGIMSQDLYLVVGSLVYSVVLLVVGNLIADILLGIVDPRVRIS
jgi:peptide/nickel transport system permease protein